MKIYIAHFIKVSDIDLTKTNIEKNKISNKIFDIESKITQSKSKLDWSIITDLKKLNTELKELDLKIKLGIEDAAITAVAVGIISSFIGVLLAQKLKYKDQKYVVLPIYTNQNILNIHLSGIFIVKMRNIISVMLNIFAKRRVKKNGRTSNRRSYAYGNE